MSKQEQQKSKESVKDGAFSFFFGGGGWIRGSGQFPQNVPSQQKRLKKNRARRSKAKNKRASALCYLFLSFDREKKKNAEALQSTVQHEFLNKNLY